MRRGEGTGEGSGPLVAWVDCSAGVAGDMLLGALIDAGAPLPLVQRAVTALTPEDVRLRVEPVTRAGLRAVKVHVDGVDSTVRRTWRDIKTLLDPATGSPRGPAGGPPSSPTPDPPISPAPDPPISPAPDPAFASLLESARADATTVFAALATAEARVHGIDPEDVHFHEVGALDAIADVVGTCAALRALGVSTLCASPVAVGSGRVATEHGDLPVPVPAVVELLRGLPTLAAGPGELATPTGAALLGALVDAWGPQPPLRVVAQGIGAGSRDVPGRANVVRVLLGEPTDAATDAGGTGDAATGSTSTALLIEANIDDLDPRAWPLVITRLLEAGAADAWLVPILMKKGRPAHTLSVLVGEDRAAAVRRVVFTETTTIGLRETRVDKHALDRRVVTVDVAGYAVRVKLARLGDVDVNAQPEWEDVAAAALASGRPAREVLAEASAAARTVAG